MKTNQEHFLKNQQGSGLVYVLIAVALFAALSFTLSRTNDTSEASVISDDQVELYASQVINYAVQAKSVIDQMMFTGSDIVDLDFSLPGQAGFTAGSQADRIHHVYHPEGGGLNAGKFPDVLGQGASDPPAGWYMGRFNTVEWTDDGASNLDVILTAYDLPQNVCGVINEKVTGSSAIPAMTVNAKNLLVDDAFHTGSNLDFDIVHCPACEGYSSLCVSNAGVTAYAFYTILADE